MLDHAQSRRTMVDCQIRPFDVSDRAVLAAFDEVPRERYVPTGREALAYSDLGVAFTLGGASRSMLTPMVLARMIQALGIQVGTKVLDVGCGPGYSSAILARLGAEVTSLETDSIADPDGVGEIKVGPLPKGWAGNAPYGAILVNGAVSGPPTDLLGQLADRGRLVCVEGDRAAHAMLYVRSGDGFGTRSLFDARAPVLPGFEPVAGFVF